MENNLKNSKCRKKYTGVWFSIAFLGYILELGTENINKKLGQNCFENGLLEFGEKRCLI